MAICPTVALPYGRLIEVLIVAGALSVRRPWNLLRATGGALEWKGITAGREAVRPLTGRHVYSLDEHGVVRVAIEGRRSGAGAAGGGAGALVRAAGASGTSALDGVGRPRPRHRRRRSPA